MRDLNHFIANIKRMKLNKKECNEEAPSRAKKYPRRPLPLNSEPPPWINPPPGTDSNGERNDVTSGGNGNGPRVRGDRLEGENSEERGGGNDRRDKGVRAGSPAVVCLANPVTRPSPPPHPSWVGLASRRLAGTWSGKAGQFPTEPRGGEAKCLSNGHLL